MGGEATVWALRAAPFEADHRDLEARGLRDLRGLLGACRAACQLEALAPGWDLGAELADDVGAEAFEEDEDAAGVWRALRNAFEDASACAWFEALLDASDAQGGALPPLTVRPLVQGLRRTRLLERLAERAEEEGGPSGWRELDALLGRAAAAGAWVLWMTTG